MYQRFKILRPSSVDEAVTALQEHGPDAKIVAGSTAITILLRQGLIQPVALVSITGLSRMDHIRVEGGVLRIGGLVKHREVELSPEVRKHAPILSTVFSHVASVRIRNAATVGGVLAEADYASDPPAALVALDAEVVVKGSVERVIPIAQFFRGFFETALAEDEVITEVRVPLAPSDGFSYHKFVTRSSEDRPCVAVTGLVEADTSGRYRRLRIAVGAATEVPLRLPAVEAAAVGQSINRESATEVAEAYAAAADPLSDLRGSSWYRREMIKVWVRRAIEDAAAMASSVDEVAT